MNVLLTCAGRRSFLVRFFRETLAGWGQVIACDASATAPALAEADRKVIVPAMDHPDYYEILLQVCRDHKIRLIVSVNDMELDGLARHASRFRALGAIPVVGSPEIVATCQDKWAAFLWLRSHGVPTPETFLTLADARSALAAGKLQFPLLIKPRWGTSSIGVERVENECELELALDWGSIQIRRTILAAKNRPESRGAFLIQEHIEGQEFGLDVVNDLKGNYAATLARRKLAMRFGNTDRAISVCDPKLDRLGKTLGEHLGHLGSVDVDVMANRHGYFVVDMNPRLGGGYPFSHLAGANLPATLIAWADGAEPDPAWLRYRPGVLSARYDGVAVVDNAPLAIASVEPNAGQFQEFTSTMGATGD